MPGWFWCQLGFLASSVDDRGFPATLSKYGLRLLTKAAELRMFWVIAPHLGNRQGEPEFGLYTVAGPCISHGQKDLVKRNTATEGMARLSAVIADASSPARY